MIRGDRRYICRIFARTPSKIGNVDAMLASAADVAELVYAHA